MKTLYKTIILAVLAVCTVSCDSFLEEDPKGKLASSTFFSNKNDLEMAIHALYRKVADFSFTNGNLGLYWAGDDISTHPASNKADFRAYDIFQVEDNNRFVKNTWNCLYVIVKASNYIINNAEKTPDTPEADIKAAIAQASYWRAYAYFHLVRTYGPLPVMLEEEIDYDKPLTAVEEVYNQIVKDLQTAEAGLPANWTGGQPKQTSGGMNCWVSQGAAKATLSYVYLCMAGWPMNKAENYALAAAKAKEVIDASESGTYYYQLQDEYWKVHSWEYNYSNKELLLAVYYTLDYGEGQANMSSMCDILAEVAGGNGWGDTCAEIKFWKAFPEGARKEATFPPKTLLGDELQDWWYDTEPASRPVVAPWYMKTAEGNRGTEFDYIKGSRQGDWIGEKNHHVVRLSEVYCWYAEAIGRSGGNDASAYTALNKVRERAGLEPINSGSLSSEQLAEAAYDEHGWEIAGYYWGNLAPRFYDMQRMNRVKDHFEYRKQNPEIEVAPGVFRKEKVAVAGSWSDDMMYAPYPSEDALMNPNLKR